MTLPKLSVALTLLLATNAASASSKRTETTQDWYAATQARGLMHRILQRNAKIQAAASNENVEDPQSSSTERHLTYTTTNSAGKQRAFNKLQKHQPPSPQDIIDSLSQYDKLWIEIRPEATSPAAARQVTSRRSGPCVWSECALDDVDDEYTGDNRDGDEQWYQFRTQTFCANAAYSLYGRKKGDVLGQFGACTGRHFINSFFTYGGSDNLLKALGQTPQVYFGGDGAYSNAECVAGDNGYSTLGCAASGTFEIAYFGGNTCDGNYFSGSGDTMTNYNANFKDIKCKEMSPSSDLSAIQTLLQGSWACDVRTYDDSCPDPYQRKSYYEYALQTAQNGGNPIRAYNHLLWKDELRLFSWVLLAVSGLLFFAAFSIKQCAIKKKPDGTNKNEYDDQLSPTASSMQTGSFRLELEDGGRLNNIMEDVSAKTLAAAAWVQWKIGRGKKPEPERTFQTSSPEKKSGGDGTYKSPMKNAPSIQMTRSTTPSAVRHTLDACVTDESALEMPPTSSVELARTSTTPQGKVVEEKEGGDKPWVTMNKPRQSLQ